MAGVAIRSLKLSGERIVGLVSSGGSHMPSFERLLSAEEEQALIGLLNSPRPEGRVVLARRCARRARPTRQALPLVLPLGVPQSAHLGLRP